ncbi:crossover junction endodeoxyribonuclease RuvC [Candidatus Gracilibacteria bacterium]|nr:crossover junction endodeoxyribonuclease RuvC [Candidatus Gracilibacteria bacterium]
MKIIGIDPGYERCGFAILEKKNSELFLKSFGIIRTDSKTPFVERQTEIARDFSQLLKKHKPQVLSIEDLFFAQNVTTGLKVAQIRGILIYLAHEFGCRILEPKPVEIKSAFCGNGKANKVEMQKMTQIIFNLESSPKMDDAADAIAAGFFATQNLSITD